MSDNDAADASDDDAFDSTTSSACPTQYKTASLPRLVTTAKVPDMAAQLQGMFGTPWGFVLAKIKFLTVGSRRNGHPQI
jgi:hypothetical protein